MTIPTDDTHDPNSQAAEQSIEDRNALAREQQNNPDNTNKKPQDLSVTDNIPTKLVDIQLQPPKEKADV